jgi:acylphosphatase
MNVRAVIIAKGEVQRVGYRDVVQRFARKMKLVGFVENIKPYDVKIVCEGDKASVESFIKLIKVKEFPIDVEDLEVRFEDAAGEFEYFEIKRGDMTEELGERVDLARAELKTNTLTLSEFRKETGDNFQLLRSEVRDFGKETGDNLKVLHSDNLELHGIIAKHDAETRELFGVLNSEIAGIKERLKRVESAVSMPHRFH